MDHGFSLVELVVVLTVMGVGIGLAGPVLDRHRDRWAVVQARDATAALFARTRASAVSAGGAQVVLHEVSARAERIAADTLRETLRLDDTFGVGLDLAGAATTATVMYDALGLGRVASRTVRFTRGRATSWLIVSAYGRITRR